MRPCRESGAAQRTRRRAGAWAWLALPGLAASPALPGALPSPAAAMPEQRAEAETCLAQAISYEAGHEPEAGQEAVAQVVLNRLRHPAYPKTVCQVVYQGSERHLGCQFTFTCDGSLARRQSVAVWDNAMRIARLALDGRIVSPVADATHYHAVYVRPAWAGQLTPVGRIGAHIFYSGPIRGSGAAGAPLVRLAGLPGPAPKPAIFSAWGLTTAVLVPVAGTVRVRTELPPAPDPVSPSPAPQRADPPTR